MTKGLIVFGLAFAVVSACNQRAEPARSPESAEPRLVPASGVNQRVPPPPPGSEAAPPPMEESSPDSTDLGPAPPVPEESPYGPEPIDSGPRNWVDDDGNVVTEELFPQ